MLMLAIFVFVTAIINREWTYVIFAAWLVGNLRLSANAMGFDTEWMGRRIPPENIAVLCEFTFAAYYLLTVTLFVELFRRELKTTGSRGSLHAVHFIPVLWMSARFCILVLTYLLVLLVIKARLRTVLWFVASMAIVLFATLSEALAERIRRRTRVGRCIEDRRRIRSHDAQSPGRHRDRRGDHHPRTQSRHAQHRRRASVRWLLACPMR